MLMATTGALALLVALVGYVLVRAIRTDRMWFIVIDPVRTERPLLYWYCFACTLFAFAGGALMLFILLAAVL
jgi:hypothetical protein